MFASLKICFLNKSNMFTEENIEKIDIRRLADKFTIIKRNISICVHNRALKNKVYSYKLIAIHVPKYLEDLVKDKFEEARIAYLLSREDFEILRKILFKIYKKYSEYFDPDDYEGLKLLLSKFKVFV